MSQTKIIRAGDIDVACRLDGPQDAPVLMLAHGLLTSHRMWDDVIHALHGRWRVLRYDLRGHGATSVTAAPYTIALLASDAVHLMDALALPRVHFVGTSLGGMIGQYLGAHHSQRLFSLALANTTATQGAVQAWKDRIAMAQREGLNPLIEPTMSRWFTSRFLASGDARLDRTRYTARATSVEGFVGCASAVRDLALVESLSSIKVPALVIVGDEDQTTPATDGRKIHDGITGSRLIALPAGHQAAIELPVAFANAVEAFASIQNIPETK